MLWTIEQDKSVREKEETLQALELHWRRMFKQPLAGADPKPSRQLQKTEPEWEWVSSLFSWCRHTALGHIHLSIRSSYCIATTTSPAFSWSKSVNCAAADSWGKVFLLGQTFSRHRHNCLWWTFYLVNPTKQRYSSHKPVDRVIFECNLNNHLYSFA